MTQMTLGASTNRLTGSPSGLAKRLAASWFCGVCLGSKNGGVWLSDVVGVQGRVKDGERNMEQSLRPALLQNQSLGSEEYG